MYIDWIAFGLVVIVFIMTIRRSRLDRKLVKREDLVPCMCGCHSLGYKGLFVKKIWRGDSAWDETEVYFSPKHAPKWDIRQSYCVEGLGKHGKRIYKTVVKYFIKEKEITAKEAGE